MLATRPPVLGAGSETVIDEDLSTALTTTDLPDSRRLTTGDADEVLGRAAAMTAHRKALTYSREHHAPRSITTMTVPEARQHMTAMAKETGVAVEDRDLETALAEYRPSLLDRVAQLEALQAQPNKTVVTQWVVEAIFESLEYYLAQRGLDNQKGQFAYHQQPVSIQTSRDGGYWRYDDYHGFTVKVKTEREIHHPGGRFLFWKTQPWTEVIVELIVKNIMSVESKHIDNGIVIRLHDLSYGSILEKIKPVLDLLRQYQKIEIVVGGKVSSPTLEFRYQVGGL
jgi:hypothetical protein